MNAMQSRIQQIVTTTAHVYGVQPKQPCCRCRSRTSDSDILLGYCQRCADALVAKANNEQMDGSPLFAPLEKL